MFRVVGLLYSFGIFIVFLGSLIWKKNSFRQLGLEKSKVVYPFIVKIKNLTFLFCFLTKCKYSSTRFKPRMVI